MSDWYKMNPVDWNDGTDDLTLEQEAAYLRLCHAIYITERPIRDNGFVVAGLLRCNERKAKRLLAELEAAGKIVIEGGFISNRRAVEELSNRNQIRIERQLAGSRGGIESGKVRAKRLKDKEVQQAIGSEANEPDKIREEESNPQTPFDRHRNGNPIVILQSVVDAMAAQKWVAHCQDKRRSISAAQAEELVAILKQVRDMGGNPTEALQLGIRKGWVTIEVEYLRNAGFKFRSGAVSSAPSETLRKWSDDRWQTVLEHSRERGEWSTSTYGPAPGEPGCLVPAHLIRDTDKRMVRIAA